MNRLAGDVTESLRSQPGRVGLSFFAVTVGMVALTGLLAMLFGLQRQAVSLVRTLGAGVAAVVPGAERLAGRGNDGLEGLVRVLAAAPGVVEAGAMVRLAEGVEAWPEARVWAVDGTVPALRGWSVRAGRGLDAADAAEGARVALVSAGLAEARGVRAGGWISVGGHAFQVVGLVEGAAGVPTGSGTAEGSMVAVLRPVAGRLGLATVPDSAAVFVRGAEGDDADRVAARAAGLFQDPALADWSPVWITPASLVRGIRALQRTLALTAGGIAGLCLVLGGTTLMSLMLAEVRQRIPEIGLRRALGARPRDIAALFVAESLVITGAAALAGVVVAAVVLDGLSGRVGVPVDRGVFTFVIPGIVSMVLGVLFSWWPARVASRLSPALALRNG